MMELKAEKKSNINRWFIIIVAVSVVLRIALQMLLPIWARGDYMVDDFLMVKYADLMANSGWLGEYDMYTLNKVPGYSIFLHLNNISGIPYMLTIGAFYSLASLVFLFVIRKFIKSNKLSLLCFWFVLFSPVLFDDNIAQKLYRQAIVPTLILFVVTAYLAMYYYRNQGFRKLLPWSILAAAGYGFFYIVREDSSWFSCFVLGATVLLVGLYFIENRKALKIKSIVLFLICIIIPFASTEISGNILCAVNNKHYGLYTKTDYNETYFAKVCKLLMNIEPEEEIPCVYISRNTAERAFEASPTFKELSPALMDKYENPASSGLVNGEFYKSFFCWNLRWAAGDTGIYESPQKMEAFFKTVYEELSDGFENGTFEKRKAIVISPYSRPIKNEDILSILKYSLKGYKDVVTYTDLQAIYYEPSGADISLDIMEDITNQEIYSSISARSFSGWVFAVDNEEKLSLRLYDNNGNEFYPGFKSSDDVYQYHLNEASEYENAKNCRFDITVSEESMDIENLYITVSSDKGIYYDGLLSNISIPDNENIKIGIDKNTVVELNEVVPGIQKDCSLLNKFIKIYQRTDIVIVLLAVILYFGEFVSNVIKIKRKQKTNFSFWIIKTGMLLTIWVNLIVVSINYFETDPMDFREYYVAGVYPIWQIFVCLSLCSLAAFVRPYIPVIRERLNNKIKKQ